MPIKKFYFPLKTKSTRIDTIKGKANRMNVLGFKD